MIICAVDAATKTGFAIGEAGVRPSYVAAYRLKGTQEHRRVAPFNMFQVLEDLWKVHRFELMAFEAPMPAAVSFQIGEDGDNRQRRGGEAVELAFMLYGAASAFAMRRRIRFEECNRQKVTKFFTGRAHWGGSQHTKKAILKRAHEIQDLDQSKTDLDIADAVAIHYYASEVFCRKTPKILQMW